MATPPNLLFVKPPEALDAFLKFCEEMNLNLYSAQEEAILSLFSDEHVILNTPTGSGKSLVALFLQYQSLCKGKKTFYTCPIKALVNEKFLYLCRIFGPENVGLSTGDASVNQSAPLIVCTAEVLSEISLSGSGDEIDSVVMDEFHYYSDSERGVAWQVPLLLLKRTQFLLMSATLGDMTFIQKDLEQKTFKKCTFISGVERPVPLEYEYSDKSILKKVESLLASNKVPVYVVHFSQRESIEFAEQLLSIDFCTTEEKKKLKEMTEGDYFSSPFGNQLKKILRHGVGLHHAGLLPKYRILVEKLAQKGLLKIICGTDTLGVGINVPIRTVLFSGLNKYDGKRVGLLSIRDFQQVAGRAGRKGYDTLGTVVVQAPEHVIENLQIDEKIKNDPGKGKKLVKKKPPEKGFVSWDDKTVERLRSSVAEPLKSQFKINYGMVLRVLSREKGQLILKNLIRDSHESDHQKKQWRKHAFKIVRALLVRGLLKWSGREIKPCISLPEQFSLHQSLSLFLVDLLKFLPLSDESLDLQVLSIIESILENPEMVLRKQLDKVKSFRMIELKMEGLEFEERILELEKCEYPKPLKEKLYKAYNEFTELHPWMENDSVKPKSIVREMIENYYSFSDYIKEYDLERSEGVLLRYLMEVYKVIEQSLPSENKSEEIELISTYLREQIKSTDSSLLEEWNKLSGHETEKTESISQLPEKYRLEKLKKERVIKIRNKIGNALRALSLKQWPRFLNDFSESLSGSLQKKMETYFLNDLFIKTDTDARNPKWLTINWKNLNECTFSQVLLNKDGPTDTLIEGTIRFLENSSDIVESTFLA